MVSPKRNHHRHVNDLHRRAKLLRDHRIIGAISSQESHEVDVGQDHGFKSAEVNEVGCKIGTHLIM